MSTESRYGWLCIPCNSWNAQKDGIDPPCARCGRFLTPADQTRYLAREIARELQPATPTFTLADEKAARDGGQYEGQLYAIKQILEVVERMRDNAASVDRNSQRATVYEDVASMLRRMQADTRSRHT